MRHPDVCEKVRRGGLSTSLGGVLDATHTHNMTYHHTKHDDGVLRSVFSIRVPSL